MRSSRFHLPLAPFSALALLAALPALASAQLTVVGPFSGTNQEGFETQDTSSGAFPPCVVDRVFNGNADLCSYQSGGAHITGGWGFGCSMQEHSGSRLLGCNGAGAVITFDSAALRFGGYFGTNNPNASHGVASFFDGGDNLLFTDIIVAPNDCTWTWNGWDFGGMQVKSIRIVSNYNAGGYMLMDDLEGDLVPGEVGTAHCYCDGSQSQAPCGNQGSPGRGCSNSFTASGGMLYATGSASTSENGLVLHGKDLVPGWQGVFFQGDLLLNGGNGYLLGDGLRCAGLNVRRLQVVMTSVGGTSETNVDLRTASGNIVSPGMTRYYQLWYRDGSPGPCSSGYNLTNALEITWTP